jgi:hypothetical protein
MTVANGTQPSSVPEPAVSKEELEQGIAELAALSPLAVFPEARVAAAMALLCGITGWIAEWSLGPWLRLSGPAIGLPPLASIAFIVMIGLILAAIIGIVLVSAARMVSSGKMTAETGGNLKMTMPVWWVRWLIASGFIAAVVLGIGGVVLGGTWLREGYGAAAQLFASAVGNYLAMTCFVALGAGFLVVIGSVVAKYFGGLRDFLLGSDRLWLIRCIFVASVLGMVAFGILMGIAALADPFFNATFLGSTLTIATVTATAMFAGWVAILLGRWEWRDRDNERERLRRDRPVKYLNDFRTWDIEAETSVNTKTSEGYPLYLWRESADNRLGLSRPRYFCVEREGDRLLLHFFNPVGVRKPIGALFAGCLVGGAAALWTLVDYFVLGHTTTIGNTHYPTPPALIVLNALLKAGVIGSLIAGAWYLVATLVRWARNRFASDGALYKFPWSELDNFRTLSAADAGAKINGEPARQGEGLAAVLTDGTQIVLTGNAWNHTSIAAQHVAMWKIFVDEREAALSRFAALLKAEQRAAISETAPASSGDVPLSL